MNYAKIRRFDVSNGPNIRTTLFVSGCNNNCEGCFNEELKKFNYGSPWTKEVEEDFILHSKDPNIHGINILGGDPLDQTDDLTLYNLLKRLKNEVEKPIWLWSGYTYEEVLKDTRKLDIIKLIDVFIDGRFQLKKRDLNIKYRGSNNQRVIDVKKTLLEDKIVEIEIK